MVFAKHLNCRWIIESIIVFFSFIYKMLKQINKTLIECSCECCECVLPGRGHIFCRYDRINFVTKQLKHIKISILWNVKCIPIGHISQFYLRFWLSRNTICFCKGWTFFSFCIIIKTILLRNCFEYVQPITRDWIYFKSGLDC